MYIKGNYYVGGLFGYVNGSRNINITNTIINVSLDLSTSGYTSYIGGFFGYVSGSSTTASITNSKYINANS